MVLYARQRRRRWLFLRRVPLPAELVAISEESEVTGRGWHNFRFREEKKLQGWWYAFYVESDETNACNSQPLPKQEGR